MPDLAANPGKQCMIRYSAEHESMPGFVFRASSRLTSLGLDQAQVGDAGIFDLMAPSWK